MKTKLSEQLLLDVEELELRVAPTLGDLVTTVGSTLPGTGTTCPPPDDSCPPPDDSCPPPDDSGGGNNGYGNDGHDGVPGGSADNDSPNSGEKAADEVR